MIIKAFHYVPVVNLDVESCYFVIFFSFVQTRDEKTGFDIMEHLTKEIAVLSK